MKTFIALLILLIEFAAFGQKLSSAGWMLTTNSLFVGASNYFGSGDKEIYAFIPSNSVPFDLNVGAGGNVDGSTNYVVRWGSNARPISNPYVSGIGGMLRQWELHYVNPSTGPVWEMHDIFIGTNDIEYRLFSWAISKTNFLGSNDFQAGVLRSDVFTKLSLFSPIGAGLQTPFIEFIPDHATNCTEFFHGNSKLVWDNQNLNGTLFQATDAGNNARVLASWNSSCGGSGCLFIAPNADFASVQIGINTYWANGASVGLIGNASLSPGDYIVRQTGVSGTSDGVSIVPRESTLGGDGTTTSATLATTGITNTLVSGKTYDVDLDIFLSDSTAADGMQVDFGGGTVSATTFRAHGELVGNAGTNAVLATAASTSLTTPLNAPAMLNTAQHWFRAHAYIKVNAGGTLVPRYAQNSHSTGTLTIFAGSRLRSIQSP